jgi:hypothetical protein
MNKIKCARCQRYMDKDKIDHDNSSAINTCKDIHECNEYVDNITKAFECIGKAKFSVLSEHKEFIDGLKAVSEGELRYISKMDLVQKVVNLEINRDLLINSIKKLTNRNIMKLVCGCSCLPTDAPRCSQCQAVEEGEKLLEMMETQLNTLKERKNSENLVDEKSEEFDIGEWIIRNVKPASEKDESDLNNVMIVRKAIREKHPKGKEYVESSIPCPLCKNGIVSYFISDHYNGHIHAQCSTEGCVMWME